MRTRDVRGKCHGTLGEGPCRRTCGNHRGGRSCETVADLKGVLVEETVNMEGEGIGDCERGGGRNRRGKG